MGLLDDAIRDHLELKRRHGASADEVAKQEKEALGPVRREPPAPAGAALGDDPAPLDDEVLVDDDELDPLPEDEVAEHLAEDEEPIYDDELLGSDDDPPPSADAGPSARASGAVRLEDDVVPADEEPGGDDVLEETPDFLQETPEHDRLWFEQKPPKDFDF